MKLTINFKSIVLLIAFTTIVLSVIIKCTESSKHLSNYREDEDKKDEDKKDEKKKEEKKKVEKKKEEKKKEEKKKEEKKKDEKKKVEKKKEEKKKEEKNKKAKKKLVKQTKQSAKELAKSYINFAKLPYCSEQKTCTACLEIKSKGYELISSEKTKSGAANISMTINRNKQKKETIVSFSGPKSNDLNFIQSIYINGFSEEAKKALNAPIEKLFWDAYIAIKPKLVKQITEILLSSEEETVIFVGHSFGGSLAILASYDLKKNKIINKTHKPKVITFAALKIGNIGFIRKLHALIPIGVIRLRSIFDLYTFIPRCVYVPSLNVFHCYTSYVNLVRVWPIFARYVYTYYPLIRSKFAWAAPGVVKSMGVKNPSLQKPLKVLPNKANAKKPNAKAHSRSLVHKNANLAQANKNKKHNNLSNANKHKLSHFSKLLKQNGRINKSKLAVTAGIKRSSSLSNLFHNVNKSSGLFKKLMHKNKSIGKSKALKKKKVVNRRPKIMKKKSFLETSMKVSEGNNRIFKRCVLHRFYLSCKYDVEVHRTFFGVNIEDC